MQKYQNNIADRSGNAVAGLTVTVTLQGGGLATIYSDNGVTTAPNPLTTDANGYFEFYAADGRYNIDAPGGGYNDVLIADTVLIAGQAAASASAAAASAGAAAGSAGSSALAKADAEAAAATATTKATDASNSATAADSARAAAVLAKTEGESAAALAQDAAVDAQAASGAVWFTTKALMDATSPKAAGSRAVVYKDPTPANNGYYTSNGTVFALDSLQPASAAAFMVVRQAQKLKADVATGKNLFNPNDPDVRVGYFINGANGQESAAAGFRTTGFIPVLPSTSYAISHQRGFAWLDAAGAYISGDSTSTGAPVVKVSPVGAAYWRTGISDANLPTFQFEKGVGSTSYEAYKTTLVNALAPLVVATSMYADRSVTPQKVDFLQVGKNKFDKRAVKAGYYMTTVGAEFANANYEISDFIPVTAGSPYTYSAGVGGGARFTCYFASDKTTVVAGGSDFTGTGSAGGTITPPVGAAYIKISVFVTSHNAFQFETGSVATAYEVYQYLAQAADGTQIAASGGDGAEVVAARGTRASLNDRMSVALDTYGNLLRYYTGESRLRKTRRKLRQLLNGVATTCVHGMIGDSWTHSPTRWTRKFVTAMQAKYGDGGPGWCGFGWNPVIGLPGGLNGSVSAFVAVAFTGTWTSTYFTSTSPDLCNAASSTAGDKITVTWSGSGNITSAKYHYITGGAIRYRWNGGAWTSLDCSTGTTADLAAIPSGTWTLEIEVVSGAPKPAGIDFRKGNGFVFHKLGASGAVASYATTVNAALYQASLAALGMDACGVMFATNDAFASVAAPTFAGQIGTIFDRLRAATPYMDIYAYMPCRNGSADPDLIPGYSLATHAICEQKDAALIDSQYLFGTTWAEYSALFVDSRHPSDTEGGYVLADGLLRFCENS